MHPLTDKKTAGNRLGKFEERTLYVSRTVFFRDIRKKRDEEGPLERKNFLEEARGVGV